MWAVIEIRTGKQICECAQEMDAIMMTQLGSVERVYRKKQYILDQIIDIPHEKIKELPGQLGLPAVKIALQENTQQPFVP